MAPNLDPTVLVVFWSIFFLGEDFSHVKYTAEGSGLENMGLEVEITP